MTAVINFLNDQFSVIGTVFCLSFLLTIGFAFFARRKGQGFSVDSLYLMILRSATVVAVLFLLVAVFVNFYGNFDLRTFLDKNSFILIIVSMVAILSAFVHFVLPRPKPANKEKP